MSWIWLAILGFFLVFFGGIFFLVNHSIQIQKRALQTIYQEQYATRQEVNRLARALDALLTDREVSPAPRTAAAQAQLLPQGIDQLLLTGNKSQVQAPTQASAQTLGQASGPALGQASAQNKPQTPTSASSLDLKM